MAKFIEAPTIIAPAGNLPKEIKEFIGVVNSGNSVFCIHLFAFT